MYTQVTTDILITLAIVVAVVLIVVLVRLYQVLDNAMVVSSIAKKRAVEADAWIDEAKKSVNSFSDVVRGFIVSLNSFANLSGKIKDLFHHEDAPAETAEKTESKNKKDN